jgi:hypothetical protein
MGWLISLLIGLAIPVFIIVTIVRRLKQFTSRLSDPSRLQKAFAESAAAALRRAGAEPKGIARLEAIAPEPTPAAAFDVSEPIPRPLPRRRTAALHRAPRPRRPINRPEPISFEMGDHFRLSVPPDLSEPHGPLPFSPNWLAFAALLGAAAYYWVR